MNAKVFGFALALALVSTPALAQDDHASATAPRAAYHLDAEVDPTAYALSGYSGHLGLGLGRVRLDLGAYAMALPQFVHGDDGFDVRFDGFGAKLQFFPFAPDGEQKGAFFGVDGGLTRVHAKRQGTELETTQNQLGFGAHLGYRIALPYGLYATPWIGFGYATHAKDVTLAGATYQASPVTIFPAVHLGYRFL